MKARPCKNCLGMWPQCGCVLRLEKLEEYLREERREPDPDIAFIDYCKALAAPFWHAQQNKTCKGPAWQQGPL